jgi:excisionase family DNA binding protein
MHDYYTPDEVAEKLRVTRRTVYSWLATGRLLGLRAGRGWRVPSENLETFLRNGGLAHAPGKTLGTTDAKERAALVRALRGKYAHAHSSVDEFCRQKLEEIEVENRRWEPHD